MDVTAAGPAANKAHQDIESAKGVDRLLNETVHRCWIHGIDTSQEELVLVEVKCALEPSGLLGDDVGDPKLEVPLDEQGDQCSADRAGAPGDDGDIRSGHGPTIASRPGARVPPGDAAIRNATMIGALPGATQGVSCGRDQT